MRILCKELKHSKFQHFHQLHHWHILQDSSIICGVYR